MKKRQKGKTTSEFRAACERLSEAVSGVAFHPDCPAPVKDDLLALCCELLNRATGAADERARFDVRLAFTALASGQLAE
jgi:hypothetical protein